MFAGRTLRAAAALLVAVCGGAFAEPGFTPWPSAPSFGYGAPQWPAYGPADEQRTAAPDRYNRWATTGPAAVAAPPPTVRNGLGQRTWNVLLGDVTEPAPQPAKHKHVPKATAPERVPAAYGTGAVYGGGFYGASLGMGSYGSPYLYGLPVDGLGYPSLLGFGGITPWVLPW